MEFAEVVKGRRSIRKYAPKEVENEKLYAVLDAARYAPSAGNIQAKYFIIIRDEEEKEKIAEICFGQYWMTTAPVHIVVCTDVKKSKMVYRERGEFYSIQDAAAAIQNMLLAAYDLGLGTCWVGAFDENRLKEFLEIPDHVKVHAIITLGYAAEKPRMPRKAPLYGMVYFDKWGKREQ